MVYDFTIYPIELVLKILFALLSSATHSYLLAIILLSIAVRIVTKPLEKIADKSVKQERALSEVLIPQINKIKTNLQGGSAHDAIKRLYSRYGYHPIYSIRSLAGLFVQLPFFLAAFYMLSGFEELRGVHIPLFGDLGRPDALLPGAVNLMPFIMVIVNLLALFTTTGFKRKDIVQGLIIAILFLFLLYNSPLALLIYWTTNNIISLALNFCSKLNFKIPSLRSYKKYNRFKDVFFEYGYIYFLFNIAISVPILGVLGDQYVFFSAHNLDGEYVLRFLILFTTIPPLLIACLRFLAKYFGFTKAYDFFVLFLFLSLFLTYTFNKVGYGVLPTIYEPYVFLFVSLVLAIVASIIICNNFIKELSIISVIVPLVLLHFILISPASALFSNVETINKKEIAASINDTPVFLFVFDEFSGLTLQTIQRNLNASRYPGFAELAAYSDYFPNALTGATETKKSIPNILSGNYRSAEYPAIPPVNNLIDFFNSTSSVNCHSPILSSEFNTLNKNYKKSREFFSDFITLYLHIFLYEDWAEKMFGVIPPTWSGFGIFHDNVAKITELDVFDNWLEYGCLEETQFNFAHIYFPHVPYYKSPLGKDLVNTGNDNWKLWSMITTGDALSPNISAVNAYQHLHLQQVGYVDAMINKLVSRLKESDLFDKSLIIITTDHGVNLNPIGVGRRAIKNNTSWANIISIPLFVKYPFQKSGETNHSFVTSLDIADTILDIVGISTPWTSVGQSLHNFPPNSQTQSVSGIPGYEEYFHDIDNQFLDSVKRKRLLFGEQQPTSSVAVNYTENLNYDSLLNTDITSLTIKNKSNFVAVMTGELKPQSGAYYGTLFSAGKPINNQIVVVTVGGKIKAIQKSGIITEKQGKGKQGKEKHGFFLFSLPETKEDQSDLSVELYQIEGLREFTLRRIQVVDQATDLSRKFKTAKGIKFDWRNSIKGTHDIEITEKNKDGILVKSTGNDPFIMFSQIKSSPIQKPIFHLKLESNTDFSLQIFYQTISQPKFSGVNLLNHKVRKGENDIYISSPVDDFNGRFRIDIGSKSDTKKVLLKVVEIKSLSVSG